MSDPVDETTQQVKRAASKRAQRRPRAKTAVELWAWSPVIVLRVSLVIVYLLYVYAGVIAFQAGIPIFTLLTWEGYTSIWAALLVPAAIVAAIGSLADRWQRIEKWSTLALTALQSGYVIGLNAVGFIAGDLSRQYVGVIALIAIVLPATRFVYLAAQSGKAAADG